MEIIRRLPIPGWPKGQGYILSLHGWDGVGKSEVARLLEEMGMSRVSFSATFRGVLNEVQNSSTRLAFLTYETAAREAHRRARGAKDAGNIVVMDRGIECVVANFMAIDTSIVEVMDSDIPSADLHIFLDAPESELLRRLNKRGGCTGREINLKRMRRVRAAYRAMHLVRVNTQGMKCVDVANHIYDMLAAMTHT